VRFVRLLPVIGSVIVVIVAFIGYQRYIPIHHVERGRLSRLIVARPPSGLNPKPTNAAEVDASSSPFAAVQAAAKRSPNSTGSYSVQWTETGSSTSGASVLASLLPSDSDAVTVQAEAAKAYLAAGSFKSDGYGLAGTFAVPSVKGEAAALYRSTSTKTVGHLATVVFRFDRVVIVEFVPETSAATAQATATSLAEAEYAYLRQLGSGFSLTATTRPLEASLIYAAVAVAIIAAMFSVPPVVTRGRRRRRLAGEEAARREVLGRGRKIAKHHAARRR